MTISDIKVHAPSTTEIWKALGLSVVTALLLSALMVPAFKLGIAPMPQIPSMAFAETVLRLLFHVAYVTFWSVAYVATT